MYGVVCKNNVSLEWYVKNKEQSNRHIALYLLFFSGIKSEFYRSILVKHFMKNL